MIETEKPCSNTSAISSYSVNINMTRGARGIEALGRKKTGLEEQNDVMCLYRKKQQTLFLFLNSVLM